MIFLRLLKREGETCVDSPSFFYVFILCLFEPLVKPLEVGALP